MLGGHSGIELINYWPGFICADCDCLCVSNSPVFCFPTFSVVSVNVKAGERRILSLSVQQTALLQFSVLFNNSRTPVWTAPQYLQLFYAFRPRQFAQLFCFFRQAAVIVKFYFNFNLGLN